MPIREYKCKVCGKMKDEIIKSSAPIPPKILCQCGEWMKYNPIAKPGFRRDHSIKGEPEDGAIWNGTDYVKEEYL